MIRSLLLAIAASALLAGCAGSTQVAAPQPAKPIDAERFYDGRWYEIARTPLSVTDGCVAGTTDFVRRTDGTLVERDLCRKGSPAGEELCGKRPVRRIWRCRSPCAGTAAPRWT